MALAEDKSVPFRFVRDLRIDFEHSEEKRGERVGRREVAADMARPRPADHFDDVAADLGRDRF